MTRKPDSAFKDHFSDASGKYAAHRPTYPVELAATLAEHCHATGTAWDAGCGSGQFSRVLARSFDLVIATDASREQLRAAQPHPRIDYRAARAEASGLADTSVDLSACAQAAHWFDLPAYYDEVRRVTRPGGLVALICYEFMQVSPEIDGIVERFYRTILAPYWPPERQHVETGYRSIPFPFQEVTLPAMGMRAAWPLASLVGYLETWSAVKAMRRALGDEPLHAVCRELEAVWPEHNEPREIIWPLSVRAGYVT